MGVGGWGVAGGEWGGRIIYLSLQCHHQSHFNVSLIVRDSHKTVSTDRNFRRERRAEADSNRDPSAYQPNALPLGHTSSHITAASEQPFLYTAFRLHQ